MVPKGSAHQPSFSFPSHSANVQGLTMPHTFGEVTYSKVRHPYCELIVKQKSNSALSLDFVPTFQPPADVPTWMCQTYLGLNLST